MSNIKVNFNINLNIFNIIKLTKIYSLSLKYLSNLHSKFLQPLMRSQWRSFGVINIHQMDARTCL